MDQFTCDGDVIYNNYRIIKNQNNEIDILIIGNAYFTIQAGEIFNKSYLEYDMGENPSFAVLENAKNLHVDRIFLRSFQDHKLLINTNWVRVYFNQYMLPI